VRGRTALFYGTRIFDDEHWGKNVSGLRYDLEGGWYKEACEGIMWIGGERVIQYEHGPGFSNLVLSDVIKQGHFFWHLLGADAGLDEETQAQRVEAAQHERSFFHFIPTVDTLKRGADPPLTAAGMPEALLSFNRQLTHAYVRELAPHGAQPPPTPEEVPALLVMPAFASEEAAARLRTPPASAPPRPLPKVQAATGEGATVAAAGEVVAVVGAGAKRPREDVAADELLLLAEEQLRAQL